MNRRFIIVTWSIVLLALFLELSLGARTTYDVIHPRPPSPTPTVPTPTFSPPTPTPFGWTEYISQRFGITLFYPAAWLPAPADSLNQTTVVDFYQGSDGFFQLGTLLNPEVIDKVCDLQAHRYPEYFGAQATITRMQLANLPACLIVPGKDNPPSARSQAILQSPWLDPSYNYIVLSTDVAHFSRIANSLALDPNRRLLPTTTPAPVSTPLANATLPTPVLTTSQLNGLTMEAYSVVSASLDTPDHLEFNQRIPASVFARRQSVRSPDLVAQIDQANTLLNPFGWRFDPSPSSGPDGPTFDIYQNGQLVLPGMRRFSPVQVDQSRTDFLTVVTDPQGNSWLLSRNGSTPWAGTEHFNAPPVFVGDSVVTLERGGKDGLQVTVLQGARNVFTLTLSQDAYSQPLVLGSLGSQWVLNAGGMLFENGRLVNRSLGFDEIFGWQLLNGQPFYFYTQRGAVGLSYDGSILPVSFNEVVHDACCEAAMFNEGGNASMVWFYARSLGNWEYVEIGAENSQ